MRPRLLPGLAALALSLALPGYSFQPEELRVLSSNAAKEAAAALAPQFERDANVRIVFRFAPSAELKGRIESGEAFDVALLTSALAADLAGQGKVDGATRVEIARSGVGVAIRKGARRPELATADGLRQALLDARSIAYVGQGVTGPILREIIDRFGIAEEMRAKTTILSGATAAEAVASGEAELGFTQISEILPHPGVELAGPLPPELQVYTMFEAVVGATARRPEAARLWIQFLKDPARYPVLRAKGLEPR